MTAGTPPVDSNATISVTCTRRLAIQTGDVEVNFELQALPPQPARQMRDRIGGAYLTYDMFVDPARSRYWGDGTQGTFPLQGTCMLNDRNQVCTIPFVLYGRVHGNELVDPGPFLGLVLARVAYNPVCH